MDIRPLSQKIVPVIESKRVSFILDHPANLSVEFNEERFRNLHLFAGTIVEKPDKHENNVLVIKGSSNRGESVGGNLNQAILNMPEGRMVYIEAGIHYVTECLWHLPSHTKLYLEGGAILKGALVCEHAEDIHMRIFILRILIYLNTMNFSRSILVQCVSTPKIKMWFAT